jgi:hypothetical protein
MNKKLILLAIISLIILIGIIDVRLNKIHLKIPPYFTMIKSKTKLEFVSSTLKSLQKRLEDKSDEGYTNGMDFGSSSTDFSEIIKGKNVLINFKISKDIKSKLKTNRERQIYYFMLMGLVLKNTNPIKLTPPKEYNLPAKIYTMDNFPIKDDCPTKDFCYITYDR